jgi:hypothetical protein
MLFGEKFNNYCGIIKDTLKPKNIFSNKKGGKFYEKSFYSKICFMKKT